MYGFITNTLGPVLVLLMMGYLLYRRGMLNDTFIETGSKLVFNLALPALLFLAIATADFSKAANPHLILLGIVCTFSYFLALMAFSHFFVTPQNARGVVIQGGFRANMGIIGLAYCANTYGSEGLAVASVYLGGVTVLFNILSVFVLNFYLDGERSVSQHIRGVLTNPLIVAIACALPLSYFEIALPAFIESTGEYFAQLTLPLALICTGATLEFRSFSGDSRNLIIATVSKCLLYPLFLTGCAYWVGFRHMELGIVMLLSIAPTAAASYIMARNLGGDPRLAASIIALTTIVSLPVTALAFSALASANLL
ncbi:AEC family transporter [Salinimonas iocasae]|uniref:AEC family transporter n=1 Tax=Salinimonas iocasae TaxID=2572577 RepID=A0A5B7YGE8_9ALTE|nr:AEC family transporter [Salinimonas iocasae]QCZ94598.1 AEC family transporter [Salinimonas iocasae]